MTETRRFWLDAMLKICSPVIDALAEGRLRRDMPVEAAPGMTDREHCTYLEAFGRTMVGFAPWLGCAGLDGEEERLRLYWGERARMALKNAVTPSSPDCMNFSEGFQPLVDAAFLAQGILRAPEVLWDPLDEETKANLLARMRETRTRPPYRNNWLLFGAMPEALLHHAGAGDWDPMRIDYALFAHEKWYKGDGWYGDGESFNLNYYNSFVIQPMLLDLLDEVAGESGAWGKLKPVVTARARHFASHEEHLISPEGTYPLLGRSLCYRFGAFQVLAQMALREDLEPCLTPAGVRCALTAVLRRTLAHPSMFDEGGWLRIGVCGSQPAMGENYISTGSLYLCSAVFLPLGLPDSAPFWSLPDEPWTSVRLWNGENLPCEHAI